MIAVAELPGSLMAVAAVADGMGGHTAGDRASEIATTLLREALTARPAGTPLSPAWLQALVSQINAAIRQEAESAGTFGMGTTLTAVIAAGDEVVVVSIGDTRCYRIPAHGDALQVTQDHSVVADALRRGIISDGEAPHHPYAHALIRALGTDPAVEADVSTEVAAPGGVAYLVCSDGVWGVLDDATLGALYRDAPDAESAVRAIVRRAVQAGSSDNASAAVLEFGLFPRPAAAEGQADPSAVDPTVRFAPRGGRRRRRWLLGPLLGAGGVLLLWLWAGLPHGRAELSSAAPPSPAVALRARPGAAGESRVVRVVSVAAGRYQVAINGTVVGPLSRQSPLQLQALAGDTIEVRSQRGTAVERRVVADADPDTVQIRVLADGFRP